MAPGREVADLSALPLAVVETITQARAPLTRQTYALKGSLFANWCYSRREYPRRCTIGVVLSFLQERLEHRLSPSTLKVYVAAIVAHYDAVDGRSLEKHDLIVRFLKGARRMNPSRPPLVPSWDLSIVLPGRQRGPFEHCSRRRHGGGGISSLRVAVSRKSIAHCQNFRSSEQLFVCHGGQYEAPYWKKEKRMHRETKSVRERQSVTESARERATVCERDRKCTRERPRTTVRERERERPKLIFKGKSSNTQLSKTPINNRDIKINNRDINAEVQKNIYIILETFNTNIVKQKQTISEMVKQDGDIL